MAKNVLPKHWNGSEFEELHIVTKASNVFTNDNKSVQQKIDDFTSQLADKIESVNGKTGKNVQITSGDITVLNINVTEETQPKEYPLGVSVKYNFMPDNPFNGINVGYGIIETLRPSTNYRVIQFLHCFTPYGEYVDTYKRTSQNNVWHSWRKELSSTDITDSTITDDSTKVASAKAVKVLNDSKLDKTGGTLTGDITISKGIPALVFNVPGRGNDARIFWNASTSSDFGLYFRVDGVDTLFLKSDKTILDGNAKPVYTGTNVTVSGTPPQGTLANDAIHMVY